MKLGQGYIFTGICDSVRGGGVVVSTHPLQVVSQHALQQVSREAVSQHALQVSRPHPGGKLRGIWPGGYPGPHPRGKLRGIWPGGSPCPHPRGKLRGIWLGGGSPGPHLGRSAPREATPAGSTHPTGMHSC